ncbi:MAG: alpha/beta fold hydrolase [Solirubrobacterales bacterium]|nr:alpha/beta fold hydrolase [Solirubrobacterales bacterium]
MEFRLLGPLEGRDGDAAVALGAPKQRALLARLLLDGGRAVAVEELIDDLWGDAAPASAPKMIQVYVSQLRKLLPPEALRTTGRGYAAEVAPEDVDVARFGRLHEEGRALLARGDAAAAAARLREALALWRGPALAGVDEPFAALERARLEDRRLACLEDRVDADLALGDHDALPGELEALLARHPHRERLREQQMLALYRAGRQPEALAAYQEHRRRLAGDLGLEPSPRLRELEGRILRQDPGLDPRPRAAADDEVRYVRSGDVAIAYQVVGDGPLDLVLVHGWVCSFHAGWEYAPLARFYRRLAGMGRLILFDKRGTGMSDRVGIAPLEERIDDVRAVMDAAGSERAVLLGISEGGPMVTLFAATHADRTVALVAMSTFARRTATPGYPIDVPKLDVTAEDWGLPIARRWVDERAPSVAHDEEAVRWYASYFVRGASPGAARAMRGMNDDIDVRAVLPSVRVPTLVIYREHDYLAEATRYMGERLPRARVVELPGADHVPWEGDQDQVLAEIERFLAEQHAEPAPDRVLATVLCVTGADRAEELAGRFRGTTLEAGGGALLASFDGPARAIRCARAAVAGAGRAGIHTGECEDGPDGLRGAPLDLARAVAHRAAPGEVLVTSTVRDLVAGAGLAFARRAVIDHAVGGEPRRWALFALSG